jgi:hypothetical protein
MRDRQREEVREKQRGKREGERGKKRGERKKGRKGIEIDRKNKLRKNRVERKGGAREKEGKR